jgi:hypothetical protein
VVVAREGCADALLLWVQMPGYSSSPYCEATAERLAERPADQSAADAPPPRDVGCRPRQVLLPIAAVLQHDGERGLARLTPGMRVRLLQARSADAGSLCVELGLPQGACFAAPAPSDGLTESSFGGDHAWVGHCASAERSWCALLQELSARPRELRAVREAVARMASDPAAFGLDPQVALAAARQLLG